MAGAVGSRLLAALAVTLCTFILADPGMAARKRPAKAAPTIEPPMQVHIVRSAERGCEPNCPEWIAAQGRIVEGSLRRFKTAIGQLNGRNLPVLIHSGGGLSDEALAIGRLLRAKGLDIGVGRTNFTPCAPGASACRKKTGIKQLLALPDEGLAICASSCAFVLAAGKRRFVGALAFVGVHRGELIETRMLYTYKVTPYRARDGSIKAKRQLISKKVVSQRHRKPPEKTFASYDRYFREMGIERQVMTLVRKTPNEAIHWLTGEELRSTKLATHRMTAGHLVRGLNQPGDGWEASRGPSASGPLIPAPSKSASPIATGATSPASAEAACAQTDGNCSVERPTGIVTGSTGTAR